MSERVKGVVSLVRYKPSATYCWGADVIYPAGRGIQAWFRTRKAAVSDARIRQRYFGADKCGYVISRYWPPNKHV
jgi:hypothetical protein